MAAEDTVNRVYREFNRYTGDGKPSEPTGAPLPVGDPQSGVHNPKKAELRAMLIEVLVSMGSSLEDATAQADRAEQQAGRADAGADRAEEYAAMAASASGRLSFKTVASLLSDTTMGYAGSGAAVIVEAGDLAEAQGFRYAAAAPDALDAHIENARGVKLVHIHQGIVDIEALGANVLASASANTVAIQKATDLAGAYGSIHVPRDGYHHLELTIRSHITGHGRLIYDGTGHGMTFTSMRSHLSGLVIDSAGNDSCLLYVASTQGVVLGDGVIVRNGYNNIIINGVTNALEIGDGAHIKDARNDNIFCIQGKRFIVAPGAFISGAIGWGINCDSTTAVSADQQHGFMLDGQIWGNFKGGIRVVGRADNLTQHPIIGGHIDHNKNDASADPSYGIYLDHVTRPVIRPTLIRTHQTAGLYMDRVDAAMIVGTVFWKNAKAYDATVNCIRPMFIGIREDPAEAGVIATPSDAIFVGSAIRSWSHITSGSGQFNFASRGILRQFQSGGGNGNIEIDLATDTATRNVNIKNGSRLDVRFLVQGGVGQRIFSGAPTGTATKNIAAYDETGAFIGTIPVYTA